MLLIAAVASAADRAATSRPADQLRDWFEQLSHSDPQVREQAKINLMGLKREELGALRQLVEESRPIAPSQEAALHEIVVHVYLSTDPYPRLQPPVGFLGVMLENIGTPWDAGDPAKPGDEVSGVLVQDCVPGFCGFRYLRPGDLVKGVGADLVVPVTMDTELRQAVQQTGAGKAITLSILRQGKMVRVSFVLDAAPQVASFPRAVVQEFVNRRREKAEEYWRNAFGPLGERGWS
jgi:hypothetical protein